MTIAAVPTGAVGLDVPLRGDVLVIKERVGHLTTRGRPVETTPRLVFVDRVDLGCAIRPRARGHRLNGLREHRCLVVMSLWRASGSALPRAFSALPNFIL